MQNYSCLIFLFVGAILAEVCFDITYVHTIFGSDLDNIPNRISYGFHLLGLTLAIMGMFDMIKLMQKQEAYKNPSACAKVDLSYFIALKKEILHVLEKLKAIIKL